MEPLWPASLGRPQTRNEKEQGRIAVIIFTKIIVYHEIILILFGIV